MRKIIILLTAVLIMAPVLKINAQEKMERNKPLIVAHRGYWNCEKAGYAKNSFAAFKCALEEGFWGTEFDLNITRDGQVVVFHDAKAEGKHFNKYDFEAFKDVRLVNGEAIPTFEDLLKEAQKHPETKLICEIKPQSNKKFNRMLVDAVKAKLDEYGLLDPERTAFISFKFEVCKWLAEELPGFDVQFLGFKRPQVVHNAGINGIDTRFTTLKLFPKWIKTANRLGMTVNCWTVNTEEDMNTMIDLGVDIITTDYPHTLREILK